MMSAIHSLVSQTIKIILQLYRVKNHRPLTLPENSFETNLDVAERF